MTWLEHNLDAYRIVSEILGDLRRAVRKGLESAYGDSWYRDGLPEDVFERLVAAKEREKSIDWYEGEYQQIMDYAVFGDLVEILEKNPEHFPELMALAPSDALLQARFVELDVMRAKLGRARPISETELSFLGTFHVRVKKAISQMPDREPAPAADPTTEEDGDEAVQPQPPAADRPAEEEPGEPSRDPAAKSKAEEPEKSARPPSNDGPTIPGAPKRVVERVAPPPSRDERARAAHGDPDAGKAPSRPPRRAVQSNAPADTREVEDEVTDGADDSESTDAVQVGDEESSEDVRSAVGPKRLAEALENGDNRTVLRELYREVTTIAESVWSSEVTPAPLVWEQVTATEWYKTNFSRLGLQALSVFYEVTDNVEQMAREGATKKQLQEFLKESNFAKTLLALRDMFQANSL